MPLKAYIGEWRAMLGDWTLGFHDSTPLDWAITLGYLGAAGLCLFAWRKQRNVRIDPSTHVRGFWLVMGIVMVLLGINKQLNFQTLLTDIGREAATQEGWFERRRSVQRLFVVTFTVIGLAAVGAVCWWVRHAWRNYFLALSGLFLSGVYAVIRAASFHHVLAQREGGPHHPISQELLEVGAVVLVSIAAWQAARLPRHSPKLQAHQRIVPFR
jgi:hypothetical protein